MAGDAQMWGYELALEGLPTWAIEEAAARWISGRTRFTGAGNFAPTPPQMRWAVDEVLQIVRGRIVTLRQLAVIRVEQRPTEETRRRAAETVAAIKWQTMDDEKRA